jgi:membrane protein YqaA with SNARE-associated domain
MIEFLKEILARLYDIRGLLTWGGTLMVCVIIFIETGMFVGFFLPGDSLLVTAGVFAGAGKLQLAWLLSLVTLCAIAGDQLGYLIGRKAGPALFRREDSRFFKKHHLARAHEFYERYGAKTIILARFVPIIRTFCPPGNRRGWDEVFTLSPLRHRRRILLGLGDGPVGLHHRQDGSAHRQTHPLRNRCSDRRFVASRCLSLMEGSRTQNRPSTPSSRIRKRLEPE